MTTEDKIELLIEYCDKLHGKMLTIMDDLQRFDPKMAEHFLYEFDDMLKFGIEMKEKLNQKP